MTATAKIHASATTPTRKPPVAVVFEPKTEAPAVGSGTKQDLVVAMLRRPEGATVSSVMDATGWQSHSVRGFFASVVRKKLALPLTSEVIDGMRVYRSVALKPAQSRSKKRHSEFHARE